MAETVYPIHVFKKGDSASTVCGVYLPELTRLHALVDGPDFLDPVNHPWLVIHGHADTTVLHHTEVARLQLPNVPATVH